MDKHSFNAECVQLTIFSKGLKEVVKFLFSLINNILLGQKEVAARVAHKLCQFDTTNKQLAFVTLEFLYNVSQ